MSVPAPLRAIGVLFLVVLVMLMIPARAEIIYDNSGPGNPTGAWYSPSEYGDEIVLGTNITSNVLTEFEIEYYGDFTPTGNEKIRVRIYLNDGPPTVNKIPTPGTVLFDSGASAIFAGYKTWTSSALNILLPDDVTWTVQFSGLTNKPGDRSGILFRNPPTVGRSFSDAWLNTDGVWQTVTFSSQPANFAAQLVSDPLTISIRHSAETVVLEWTGASSILQVSSVPSGPYQDLPQFRNRYTFSTHNAPAMFWRLRGLTAP